MNRRDFFRASALTAAGLYVAPDVVAEPRRRIFPVGIDLRRPASMEVLSLSFTRSEDVYMWGEQRLPFGVHTGWTRVDARLADGRVVTFDGPVTIIGQGEETRVEGVVHGRMVTLRPPKSLRVARYALGVG